jgi:hypothetical protein
VSALLWSLTSFQVALGSAETDLDLLQFIDGCVKKCCHDVQCRVSDKQILQRQLTGSFTPGVAHVKGSSKRSAAGENDAPSAKKFKVQQQSAISNIVSKAYAPAPKGNGDHLPQSQKQYCEYCSKWIAKSSFANHLRRSKTHKQSEASLKATGSKCTCDNSLVIVLFALNFCCSHVVPNL